MKNLFKITFLSLSILTSLVFVSCAEDGIDGINGVDGVDGTNGADGIDGQDGKDLTLSETMFENKSNLKPLVALDAQFNFVEAYSLISSSDVIDVDGQEFRIGGGADGAGFLPNATGDGYEYVVNFEDHFSVARISLDKNFNVTDATYLLNSSVDDFARQCSGTMWEKDIHGGSKDLFLSASEAFSYDVKGIDPFVDTPTPTADFGLDALGEFAWENAVPLPKDTYSGKTVIIGGDDDSSSSEGQVTLYYSENGDDDLDNGKIYVLRLKEYSDGAGGTQNVEANTSYTEADLDFGVTYEAEFVEIVNGKDLTKDDMETACLAINASQFMRVEDVDYQKGADANARNVFFAVTGRGPGRGTYNDWGTVYKLELDIDSPLTGKVTQIISGNTNTNNADGNLPELQSPDNICVTEHFIYTQEDPNSFSRNHAAYIYQSDLNGNNPKKVLELVVRQDLDPDKNTTFNGEFGSLIDVSDKIGVPDTFILALQPHYWKSEAFAGVDGGTNSLMHPWLENTPYLEGSQIVVLKGLPR